MNPCKHCRWKRFALRSHEITLVGNRLHRQSSESYSPFCPCRALCCLYSSQRSFLLMIGALLVRTFFHSATASKCRSLRCSSFALLCLRGVCPATKFRLSLRSLFLACLALPATARLTTLGTRCHQARRKFQRLGRCFPTPLRTKTRRRSAIPRTRGAYRLSTPPCRPSSESHRTGFHLLPHKSLTARPFASAY